MLVAYIRQDIQHGMLAHAQTSFHQYTPGQSDFVMFCVSHDIDLSKTELEKIYQERLFDRAEGIIRWHSNGGHLHSFITGHTCAPIVPPGHYTTRANPAAAIVPTALDDTKHFLTKHWAILREFYIKHVNCLSLMHILYDNHEILSYFIMNSTWEKSLAYACTLNMQYYPQNTLPVITARLTSKGYSANVFNCAQHATITLLTHHNDNSRIQTQAQELLLVMMQSVKGKMPRQQTVAMLLPCLTLISLPSVMLSLNVFGLAEDILKQPTKAGDIDYASALQLFEHCFNKLPLEPIKSLNTHVSCILKAMPSGNTLHEKYKAFYMQSLRYQQEITPQKKVPKGNPTKKGNTFHAGELPGNTEGNVNLVGDANRAIASFGACPGKKMPPTLAPSHAESYKALCLACQNGNHDTVKTLLEKESNRVLVNQTTESGATPLHIASESGQIEVIKLLLERRADVNQSDKNGYTPLYSACQNADLKVAQLLLESGAAVNQSDINGWTPLHAACQYDHLEVARLLLDKRAVVNQKDSDDWTPLHFACRNPNSTVIQLLLDRGATVDQPEKDGWTSLHVACLYGHLEVTKQLLARNADVNKPNNQGETPLYIAYKNGHFEFAQYLRDCGDHVKQQLQVRRNTR